MEFFLVVLLLVLLAGFATAPLWRATSRGEREDPVVADLEARKEAKYREIRDAELDREQGKLSDADWARADAALRQEAIEILRALDEARGGSLSNEQ